MAGNAGRSHRLEAEANENVFLQKDTENSINRVSKQRESIKKIGNIKKIYTLCFKFFSCKEINPLTRKALLRVRKHEKQTI